MNEEARTGKLRAAIQAALALTRRGWSALIAYSRSLQASPRARFLTLAWGFCVLFLAAAWLSASNPLRLLVPGLAFPAPVRDSRPAVTLYAVRATDGGLVALQRRMQPEATAEGRVRAVLHALVRPASIQVQETSDVQDLIPIPLVSVAVRKVWVRGGMAVVDLRTATVSRELERTAKNRRPVRDTSVYMDAFARSFARSVIAAVEGVTSVQLLFDGEPRRWKGLALDVSGPLNVDALERR